MAFVSGLREEGTLVELGLRSRKTVNYFGNSSWRSRLPRQLAARGVLWGDLGGGGVDSEMDKYTRDVACPLGVEEVLSSISQWRDTRWSHVALWRLQHR